MNTANKIEKMSAIWKRVGHANPIYGMLELTDKQIDRIKRILDERETKTRPARIAASIAESNRIKAILCQERAAKKAAPDCCHTCGDISDEYTCRDGKLYCDGCEAVRHNNITDWCEPDVDARDSPNVYPYKKCGSCHERSSCGNYTNDHVWLCEDCGFCDY